MKIFVKCVFTLLVAVSLFTPAIAQENPTPPKIIVSGGVVNGKANSLPKPEYPESAKAVKASGAVNVQVMIDETGSVISAAAVSGHPLLRAAAVAAARQAKFTPIKNSGQLFKVTGVIVYNFFPNDASAAPETAAVTTLKSVAETMKPFGLGMLLRMLRDVETGSDPMRADPELKTILTKTAADFPNLKKELLPLNSLTELSLERQIQVTGEITSAVKGKLTGADVWRFELGENYGETLALVFNAFDAKGKFQFSKFDKSAFQINLLKIRDSIYIAPPETSTELLEKFKSFAKFADKQKFQTEEDLVAATAKFGQFFESLASLKTLK